MVPVGDSFVAGRFKTEIRILSLCIPAWWEWIKKRLHYRKISRVFAATAAVVLASPPRTAYGAGHVALTERYRLLGGVLCSSASAKGSLPLDHVGVLPETWADCDDVNGRLRIVIPTTPGVGVRWAADYPGPASRRDRCNRTGVVSCSHISYILISSPRGHESTGAVVRSGGQQKKQ